MVCVVTVGRADKMNPGLLWHPSDWFTLPHTRWFNGERTCLCSAERWSPIPQFIRIGWCSCWHFRTGRLGLFVRQWVVECNLTWADSRTSLRKSRAQKLSGPGALTPKKNHSNKGTLGGDVKEPITLRKS